VKIKIADNGLILNAKKIVHLLQLKTKKGALRSKKLVTFLTLQE